MPFRNADIGDVQNDPFHKLLEKLTAIDALGQLVLPRESERLAELKRQAAAAAKRRSRDEQRYTLGGLMFSLDLNTLDYHALYGLLAHPDHLLVWAIEARASTGAGTLANIIRLILDDKERAGRCAEWGQHLAWSRMRQLYEAEVNAFISSEKCGPKARWRRDPITAAQNYLISEICKLDSIENPTLTKKGQAFDWLRERGGNPRFLARPAPMPLMSS